MSENEDEDKSIIMGKPGSGHTIPENIILIDGLPIHAYFKDNKKDFHL